MVPPLEFIPCCEEIGVIIPAGIWIMREACKQLRIWTQKLPAVADLTISVNLSAQQLNEPDLISHISQIIEETGISASSLVLEITESVVIRDAESAKKILSQIRALGVRLHMDDFGTGYSSLSCLHEFPLDGLKIDRRFIQNIDERRDYAAVVHAIVSLARNLGMKLIAEGVETASQVSMLQALECDLAQGYHFDVPREAAGAEEFIQRNQTRAAAA